MMRLADCRESLCILFALLLLFLLTTNGAAAHLPIRIYTTTDGLSHNRIGRIVLDSRGFLWFCTGDGLSRFDGSRFVNYNVEDGLPSTSINSLLETPVGSYWVATNGGGVALLNSSIAFQSTSQPRSRARYTAYQISNDAATNRVNVLLEDRAGILWAGTDGGLFWLNDRNGEREFHRADLQIPSHPDLSVQVWALAEGDDDSLWVGTKFGLIHRFPNSVVNHYQIQPGKTGDSVWSILKDEARLWLAHDTGVIAFKPDAIAAQQSGSSGSLQLPYANRYSIGTTPGVHPRILFRSSNGRIWESDTGPGLSVFDGTAFQQYPVREFLGGVVAIAEDREGNLWLGTQAGGALRLAMHGFNSYDSGDGLGPSAGSVFEDHQGQVYVSGRWEISRFDGERFATVKLSLPKSVTETDWRPVSNVLVDRAGDWWVGTRVGLYRFGKVNHFEQLGAERPNAVYTRNDGLADDDVTRLFEDSRGDLWIGGFSIGPEVLTRWERATGTFHRYSKSDGLTSFRRANSICEDRAGNIWVAFDEGGLARYKAGRFELFGENAGIPPGSIMSLHIDQAGHLWFSHSHAGALFRIDDTDAAQPQLTSYGKDDGLNVHRMGLITGDLEGRIYVGNSVGLDQVDPKTGLIRHYGSSDGVPAGDLLSACRDRSGTLWLVTPRGLLRFIPRAFTTGTPPTISIDGLHIAGNEYQLSVFGETEISGLEIEPNQNQIQIEFSALSFGAGESLRYQYILEGSFSAWSAPSKERSVNFANLAPGSYRFLVRAISASGLMSEGTASAKFKVLYPIWRRPWFLALAALIASSVLMMFGRSRIKRVRAVTESEKRFRTLAETASDAIITIDENSRILYVNEAAQRVFGYTEQEMMGAELTMLMPEYLRHLHREGFARYQRTGERHISWRAVELPGRHKSGEEIPLELSFGEFTKDDKRLFTGIVRDITERKRAEQERKQAEEALRRSREERLAELERVRSRIATDLHDDIGSSLTQIAILSEVAHQEVKRENAQLLAEPLTRIINVSNELVETMSDIVWAINPRKDHLSDLAQRMRRFASDVFTARRIAFRFDAPEAARDLELGANLRREVFLIFKEMINNVVKHSHCSRAQVDFHIQQGFLVLKITDDGVGFDSRSTDNGSASSTIGGNGIPSMRRRAQEMGGRFEIVSASDQGTTVTLTVSVEQSEDDEATRVGGAAGDLLSYSDSDKQSVKFDRKSAK